MNKPIFLFTDEQIKFQSDNQERLASIELLKIKNIVIIAMADKPFDYQNLIDNGSSFLVSEYINEYAKDLPKHLNQTKRFTADTGIDLDNLGEFIEDYKRSTARLLKQPTIKDGNYKSNLVDNDFAVYVAESKRDFYKAAIQYTKIITQIKSTYDYDIDFKTIMDMLSSTQSPTMVNGGCKLRLESFR